MTALIVIQAFEKSNLVTLKYRCFVSPFYFSNLEIFLVKDPRLVYVEHIWEDASTSGEASTGELGPYWGQGYLLLYGAAPD